MRLWPVVGAVQPGWIYCCVSDAHPRSARPLWRPTSVDAVLRVGDADVDVVELAVRVGVRLELADEVADVDAVALIEGVPDAVSVIVAEADGDSLG